MTITKRLLAATALTLALTGAASAKTLVYCSEGSPEGFDPALYRMLLFGIAMVGIMVWRPRGLVASRAPTIALNDAGAISGDLVRQGRG